jgi:hypothetical protein
MDAPLTKPEDVYAALVAEDRVTKLLDGINTNVIEKYALRLGALLFLASVLLLPFEPTMLVGAFGGLVACASLLLYSVASIVGGLRYFLTPTKSYVTDLLKRLESEEKVVAALANEAPEVLEKVQRRLEFERSRLASRMGFLLGVVDKLGIIPAFITLYLAYAKVTSDPMLEHVPYPVLGFVCGVYVGAFFNKHLSDRFEVMNLVLGNAYEKAKQRRAIQEP